MNLYQVMDLENEIESLAAENAGEIDEVKFGQLIVAQTQAVEKLEKLCQFLKNLDTFVEAAALEETRIAKKRESSEEMIKSIKRYIAPYVASKGKITVGTFTLSIRKSKGVVIQDEGLIPEAYRERTIVELKTIDKKKVKKAIENGENVPGAILEIRDNLQIK